VFGRPLLLGMSNKRFLGAITEMPVDQRNLAGAVAAALGYQAGAAIFRVHDVGATRQALAVAAAMKRGNLDG
ncbi:MAG: dihydropteroate synthase, partial [Clostridiales bacterium]